MALRTRPPWMSRVIGKINRRTVLSNEISYCLPWCFVLFMIKVALSINNCSNTYLQTAGSTQVQRWYGISKSFCVQEMYEYCKALKKKKVI